MIRSIPFIFSFLFFLTFCNVNRKVVTNPVSGNAGNEKEVLFASLYVDGVSARLRNDWEEAIKKMEECLKINSASPSVYYEIGLSLNLSGQSSRAISYAEQAYRLDPSNKWFGLFYADLLNEQGKPYAALNVFEELTKKYPDDVELLLRLAEEYRKAGKIEKAIECFNKVEKKNGIDEEITLNKISLLKEKNNVSEIEKEYKKLIQKDSTECRFRNYLADFYLQTGKTALAEAEFEKIFSICPDYPPALILLAGFYVEQFNFSRGMKYILHLIRSPEVEVSLKSKVLSALEKSYTGNTSNTIIENGLREGIFTLYKLHPQRYESCYWFSRYYTLYRPQPDSAFYFSKLSLAYDKTHPEIWKKVIDYFSSKNQWDSTYSYAVAASELYPNDPFFFIQKGTAAYYLKNYRTAIQDLKYALEIPGLSKKENIQCMHLIARAYYYLKEYEASDQYFENILKINADLSGVLNDYAWSLIERKKDPERAEKLARKAYELNADNPHYADTYGKVLLHLKKIPEALEKLKLALSISPDNPLILEHVGDAFSLSGKTDEAKKYWEKALQKGGSAERLSNKIKTGRAAEYE
jgi:tetratricopeptide (TPR) repeat protein